MALGNTKIVAEYDFDEDAIGLEGFIDNTFKDFPEAFPVVYVRDKDGNNAVKAELEEETLTDGSKVYNIIIKFDE